MPVIEFKRRDEGGKRQPRATFILRRDGTLRAIIECSSSPDERHGLYLAIRNSMREIFYRHTNIR